MHPDRVRPQFKGYAWRQLPGEIHISREVGIDLFIADPDGQVAALLGLLDGSRTVAQLARALAERWPELTQDDTAQGLAALDEAGLLEDAASASDLSAWQQERYFSNLAFFGTFASIGRSRYTYQAALRRAHVLLLGVGGLGSTLLYNLAGMGVGHVTALDFDRVEARNLARQFLYSEADVGQPKLQRAVARARAFNSEMRITPVERCVEGPQDIAELLPGVDLVISAIDKPANVQDWVNATCVEAGVPFITGGMQVGRGLYYSVQPGRSGCRECMAISARRANGGESLSWTALPQQLNRGIGPVATTVSALIGLETLRYLSGFAPPVSAGAYHLIDFSTSQISVAFTWDRQDDCPVCGALAAQPPEALAALEAQR